MSHAEPPNGEPTPVVAKKSVDATVDTSLDLARLAELGRPLNVGAQALILDNFKSFPRKTRIPLRDGFSTISGPNGSGKSNLIDALQFVLAVSTSKTMRAERLSDLISDLGSKPSCRVALELECTFPGVRGGPPITEIVELARGVRRRASGTQVRYQLNKNPIRLSDLHDVLRHLGFPVSGQNFVLQNDVIRLTSMGGVARRQCLDELAGAKDFDRRIGLAHQELQCSDRLTEDTRLILAELAGRLEQLKKERDQALAFQELTGRKQSLGEDLVVLEVTEAEVKVVGKAGEIEAAEKAQRSEERKREKLEKEALRARVALEEVEKELATKGEGERMQAFRAVETLRARQEATREKARDARAAQEAQEQRRPQLEQDVRVAERTLEAVQGQVVRLEGELKEKQGQLSQLAQRFEAAGAGLQREGKARFEKADQIRALRQEAESLRAEEGQLVTRERELGERRSRCEAEQTLLATQVAEAQARREALGGEGAAAAQEYRERREALAGHEERRRRLLQQIHSLRSGMESVSSKVSRAQQELAAARACREQAHAMGGGQALAAIREANLRGIHGTVANLVEFEGKYAQALEAAAGSRLNYVVTDDEHVAAEAIRLLKRTRAGRLSFAPLSKVRGGRRPGAKPRGREVVGFAIDLVSANRRYADVLQTVFSDTLVVETLEGAKPLIGQYRMVTLDGDLIERNAIMSGGSSHRRGGLLAAAARAGELVSERQRALRELEKQREAALSALRKAETGLAQVSEQVQAARVRLAESETGSSGLAAELTRLEETLAPQAERLEALRTELTAIAAEQAQLSPRLSELRQRLRAADEGIEALDEPDGAQAYAELQRQAEEAEQAMRPLEKEVDRLRQEHALALAERSSAEARLEAARKVLAEAIKAATAMAERIAELEREAQAQGEELAAKEKALEELSSELAELTRRRNAAREQADQARDRARDSAREVEVLAERIEGLREELEELTLRANTLRTAAEEREIEVPGPEEAPADLERERARIHKTLGEVERKIAKLGAVNHLAIEQYDEASVRHDELGSKIEVLEAEKREIRERIVDLEGRKRTAFLDAFERVAAAFSETYRELGRGEGKLLLEDPKDPFAGGLQIKVRPRGKKLSRMEVMSGGEKALTALALIFALQEVNPAPLFIFDEVDKDLDGVNTKILASAIRRRADERQYLVISHHRVLLEQSDQTLGVTMRKGFGTQVTGVSMQEESVEQAAAAGREAVEASS